jgi:hypothetical protein
MNRILSGLLLAMLLSGGCARPTDTPAASRPESRPASGAGDSTTAAQASAPATTATDRAPAATAASGDAPAKEESAAIDASIDSVLGDHTRYRAVIEAYRQAIIDGDKPAVAALVKYPLRVDIGGRKTTISDASAFVRDYDKIITADIARTIEAQKYSELMVNGQGVMFGSGETWINGVCKEGSADCSEFEVKVVAIQAGASD